MYSLATIASAIMGSDTYLYVQQQFKRSIIHSGGLSPTLKLILMYSKLMHDHWDGLNTHGTIVTDL